MQDDETKSDAEQATSASDSPTVAPTSEAQMSTITNTATATKSTKSAAPKAKKAKVAKGKTAKTAKKAKKANGNGKANGVKRVPRDGNKTQEVLAMLRKSSGLTRAKILEHTGWKAVSVQQLVVNAGLNPDKDLKISEERPFTYRLTK